MEGILADLGVRASASIFLADEARVDGGLERAIGRWWDLPAIAARHQAFLSAYGSVVGEDLTPQQAFAAWIGCLDAWRVIPYVDPGLPAAWLPADWPGNLSVPLFADLREQLEDLSGRYVRQVTSGPTSGVDPGSRERPRLLRCESSLVVRPMSRSRRWMRSPIPATSWLAVVTRPDAPSGRGKRLTASPVAQRATELGIEVLKPQRPRDEEFVTRLAQIAPDCCPVVAYGALLPQRVLDIPRHGWVNLHFSLLPAWRGAAPVQHAILAGDQMTGATTFQIVLELDAGPIFATVTEPIRPDDTAGDLLHRLSLSGARLLVDTLDGIEDGTLMPTPQPETDAQVSYASKINVEDARIDWTQPAEVVHRLVRACAPAPGAWTTFRGERFKINSAQISDAVSAARSDWRSPNDPCGSAPRLERSSSARFRPRARSRWLPPTGHAVSRSTQSPGSVPE